MEPQIRYCMTEDCVSIAYCEGGEGTPFISLVSQISSNIELEWRDWEWYRIMAARRRGEATTRADRRPGASGILATAHE